MIETEFSDMCAVLQFNHPDRIPIPLILMLQTAVQHLSLKIETRSYK